VPPLFLNCSLTKIMYIILNPKKFQIRRKQWIKRG
jgi:hypothetical protein